jgi:poly-gamma-glutamate capsule biosynthesis protein CapA/YwtB (metallophosphatase superfamily)
MKYVITFILILGFLTGCSSLSVENSVKPTSVLTDEVDNKSEANFERESDVIELESKAIDSIAQEQLQQPKVSYLNIMAVGDIMMHSPQISAGFTSAGYNFNSFFEEVKPIFREADVVIGNLETTMSGPDVGYSGYPLFNSPDELADALKDAGFTVIITANNHSLDRREKGLVRTLEQLDRVDLKYTGTFRTEEDRNQILLIEKNDISIAILAYTYGTNGIPIPDGKEYLVNLIDRSKIEKDIQQAKTIGADIVAVSIHFGYEYHSEPNQEQKELVNQLFEWGADLILGSHPHVLQPFEERQWINKEGEYKQGVAIYSLGNFISNQRKKPRDMGGILSIDIKKTGEYVEIEETEFNPTWVHRYWNVNRSEYRILPLGELLEARDYPYLNEGDYQQLEERYHKTLNHVHSEQSKVFNNSRKGRIIKQ